MSLNFKPMVLVIMDGWGLTDVVENNAIAAANTPNMDRLVAKYPHTSLRGSGAEVGLPADQMGNSEVGHLNIGAGRVVYQEYTRVSRSIKTGSFYTNQTLVDAVEIAKSTGKAVHVMGLLSDGGVHSHEEHIHAMMELAVKQGVQNVYLHAFLDGRDTPPKSALAAIDKMQAHLDEMGAGQFASVIGRFYAMDRDHRWPRIKQAYDVISNGMADFNTESAHEALEMAYQRDETDEFVKATAIHPKGVLPVQIQTGDVIVFMNFRSDRARQITRPFIEDDFDAFDRGNVASIAQFVCLTEYNSQYEVPVAYPPERLKNVFGEYISRLGMRQLRIAETEKYAHVTFFFNGGREEPFEFEERILVPSPDVKTYDLQPEMNAPELTTKLVEAIKGQQYDVIICNYANPDMVGHTGNFDATVKAIECMDRCIAEVVEAVLQVSGEILITADHGNAEKMLDAESGQAHTAHTINPVPLIYVGREAELETTGALSDITPTMLYLMGIEQPSEMLGRSLVKPKKDQEQTSFI
ncbi:2,3-bisphosphoglycerate-independent phosphoglycerate mutase [Beggiatoa alba]|nr:2,3-bisphosphoglycerate-independent phosphoglycerate mutase [Beggiatoa alba]